MSNRSQPPRRPTAPAPDPPPAAVPAVITAPEETTTAPPRPSGGARHQGALQVAHSMVGRFVHGEVLRAEQIAEFTQDRLNDLLREGALVPPGTVGQGAPQRPIPAEDAAFAQAAQQPPGRQDFDQRPGRPRAG